jgi:hypothetical protein
MDQTAAACAAIIPFAGIALWAQLTVAAAALAWYLAHRR